MRIDKVFSENKTYKVNAFTHRTYYKEDPKRTRNTRWNYYQLKVS